jgi:glycosyltransferase involved in cell wall biosynthesis
MSFDNASVIIPTYNRPRALRRILLALDEQTIDCFEVVVADDGSSDETRETIDHLRERVSFELKHAWQEDRGYRPRRIRNLGVFHSTGDYLIFLDGDCLPFPDYIEMHRYLAEPGWFVRGTRNYLWREFSERVLAEDLPVTRWGFPRWLLARLMGEADRATAVLRVKTQALRKRYPRRTQGCMTCNLGVWRADFFEVDGLDQAYTGWGLEDIDLVVRLINAGIFRKEGRLAVPVLHLWHPNSPESEENVKLLQETIESGAIRARKGISTLARGEAAG